MDTYDALLEPMAQMIASKLSSRSSGRKSYRASGVRSITRAKRKAITPTMAKAVRQVVTGQKETLHKQTELSFATLGNTWESTHICTVAAGDDVDERSGLKVKSIGFELKYSVTGNSSSDAKVRVLVFKNKNGDGTTNLAATHPEYRVPKEKGIIVMYDRYFCIPRNGLNAADAGGLKCFQAWIPCKDIMNYASTASGNPLNTDYKFAAISDQGVNKPILYGQITFYYKDM